MKQLITCCLLLATIRYNIYVNLCVLYKKFRTSRTFQSQSLSRNLSYHVWGLPSQVQIVPSVKMQDISGEYDKTGIKLFMIHLGRGHPSFVFVDKYAKAYPHERSTRQIGEESLSKAVSKNITRILEDLLKDYDKTERPSYKEG